MRFRLNYWAGRNQWWKPSKNRTAQGWALHCGPLTLVIDTDRLP